LREADQEVQEAAEKIARLEEKIARDAELIAQKFAIRTDVARLKEARKRTEQLEPEIAALHQAKQERVQAVERLERAKQQLQHALNVAETEWRHVEERARKVTELDARLADLLPKLEEMKRAERESEQTKAALAEAQQAFANLSARHKQILA